MIMMDTWIHKVMTKLPEQQGLIWCQGNIDNPSHLDLVLCYTCQEGKVRLRERKGEQIGEDCQLPPEVLDCCLTPGTDGRLPGPLNRQSLVAGTNSWLGWNIYRSPPAIDNIWT